uniref:Uncharacterized protein n=1 Tax=Panagrolaimus superbus TaxID=310955 RepID=A0A914YG69_9BILA
MNQILHFRLNLRHFRIDKLFDPKKQFIVDGKLIIKCEGYIIREESHPKLKEIDDSGLHPVQESKDLWENSNEKTCHINVNGKLIYLHQEIFNHLFPESFRQNPVIFGFSFDSVELAIKFNYDFRLVYPLTLEESLEIFKFMKIYGRKGIIHDFERFLIEEINEST